MIALPTNAKAIVTIIFSLSPLRARKSDNYLCRDSWKIDNFRERAFKKEAKNGYQKGLRVITLEKAIKKSPILLSQYWKMNDWMSP